MRLSWLNRNQNAILTDALRREQEAHAITRRRMEIAEEKVSLVREIVSGRYQKEPGRG